MKPLYYALLTIAASSSAIADPAQVIYEQHSIVRIRTYATPPELAKPLEWKEYKGPRCIELDQLGAASISSPGSIDLGLRRGQHLRAILDKMCPANAFFYSGFYLTHAADGQVCAGRDVFHARIGGDCAILRFRNLKLRH